jgi:hypothetical protein
MKKFLVILMMLTFAAGAFAQDAAKTGPEFKYSVWANAFAITENTAAKDTTKDYSAIRVRPMFSMGNENVSVVTRFEIDQYYGKKAGDVGYADPDTDQMAVEVKWAYINVKDMLIPGLSMTAGLAPYVYSVGFNNDMPLFNLVYDAGMVKVDLAYIKFEETLTTEETAAGKTEDDAQAYAVKLPINLGDITITPSVLYYTGEMNAEAGYEETLTMPALGVKAAMGALSIDADFVYIMGEYDNGVATADVAAYAAYVNAGFKASDSIKISVFGLYTTGQDDSADFTSFADVCKDEVEVGPLFIINDNGNINQVGVTNEYDRTATEGLSVFGLAAEFKMDKFTALAQVAYAMTNEDVFVEDTDLGIEMDLRLSYEVAPKTALWVEGAYLMAGKYIEATEAGNEQDITYYAAGLMTSI